MGRRQEAKDEAKQQAKESKRNQEFKDSSFEENKRVNKPRKVKPWKYQKACIIAGVVFVLFLILSIVFPLRTQKEAVTETDDAFAKKAVSMIRSYVSSRYSEYAKGKVVLRHLKQ